MLRIKKPRTLYFLEAFRKEQNVSEACASIKYASKNMVWSLGKKSNIENKHSMKSKKQKIFENSAEKTKQND